MRKLVLVMMLAAPLPALGQTAAPPMPPIATDVTSEDVRQFLDALPRDQVSDRPIRVVDVTGGYRVAVYGVYRPEEFPGGANLHRVNTTEIYYMLTGHATLVTGGTITDATDANPSWQRGSGIAGGVSRRVGPGDVIIIPGHTPHWFSELESDLEYLIFRPDPDNRIPLR